MFVQIFSKSFIVADYYLNTEEFAAFCINKDKPAMHCCGSCQMDKMLKKVDQNEQEQQQTKNIVYISVFIPATFSYKKANLFFQEGSHVYPPVRFFKPKMLLHALLKPPRIVS